MKLLICLMVVVSAATALSASDDINRTNEESPISTKTIKFIEGIGKDVKTFLRDNKLIENNTSKGITQ